MDSLCLEFFGAEISVSTTTGDVSDLEFLFGPHVVPDSRAADRLQVEFGYPNPGDPGSGDAWAELVVRRDNGPPLLRRAFRGWSNVPPPVPPFSVLRERFSLVQAVVLAKGSTTIALIGSPHSDREGVALALAQRSWRMVSGQLLITDRTDGNVMPYHVPLEFRGATAVGVRAAGLAPGTWRSRTSPLTGDVLMVRPEALGDIVPVRARLGPPQLFRLCRSGNEGARLESWDFPTQTWPPEAAPEIADAPSFRLELPESGGAEEAAGLIDHRMTSERRELCPDVPVISRASPVGSTASLLI
ncbi:hypothetical protein ACGFYY_16625 [Streptomyces sp. NPDC048331]|uniref:hypothetical protein n=1 Tax=Streptomyces sp. NPDC048331 TaxID=3365534 RepID=UPI0037201FF1